MYVCTGHISVPTGPTCLPPGRRRGRPWWRQACPAAPWPRARRHSCALQRPLTPSSQPRRPWDAHTRWQEEVSTNARVCVSDYPSCCQRHTARAAVSCSSVRFTVFASVSHCVWRSLACAPCKCTSEWEYAGRCLERENERESQTHISDCVFHRLVAISHSSCQLRLHALLRRLCRLQLRLNAGRRWHVRTCRWVVCQCVCGCLW